jgi:uncharacterized membrane protein HdeD (DUF308 family)
MELVYVRHWWALALRGAASVAFGVFAFAWPKLTLTVLVLLFGAYSLVDGAFAILAGTIGRLRPHSWLLPLEGLIGVAIGFAALLWTGMTELVLVNLIALWAMFTGVIELFTAVRLRRVITGELWLGACGIASLVLGAIMLIQPQFGVVIIVAMLATYALFFGTAMILLALRMRRADDLVAQIRRHAH